MRGIAYFTTRNATRRTMFQAEMASRARFPRCGQLALETRICRIRKPHNVSRAIRALLRWHLQDA